MLQKEHLTQVLDIHYSNTIASHSNTQIYFLFLYILVSQIVTSYNSCIYKIFFVKQHTFKHETRVLNVNGWNMNFRVFNFQSERHLI